MALAARRDPAARAADVRTACPVCGGSIHPVAGRCKHCRADLVKLREHAAAHGAPGVGALPVPPPFPVPTAPVMLGAPPPRAWWRRWPLVVTIVAAGAIVVCIALLLTGESRSEPARRRSAVPPMDRMDTDPLPERADRTDPWQGSDQGPDRLDDPAAPDPAQPPPRDPDSPWPPPDTPAPDTADPAPGQTGAAAPRAEEFFSALTRTACRRLGSCGMGSLGGAALIDVCEQIGASVLDVDLAARLRSGHCRYDGALAAACLRAIEREPCATQTMDFDQLARRWMSIDDCGGALQCR
jgi:hypothetical protein